MKKLTVKEVLERNINKYVRVDYWGNSEVCGLSNDLLHNLDDFTLNYHIISDDIVESDSDVYDIYIALD